MMLSPFFLQVKPIFDVVPNTASEEVPTQQFLRDFLSDYIEMVLNGEGSIFVIFALAFAYGLVHALGPGHGKFIVSSFLIAHPTKAKRAGLLGLMIGLLHVLSGAVVFFTLKYILYWTVLEHSEEAFNWSTRISYLFLLGLGLYFLLNNKKKAKEENLLSVALVPCPASIIVLTFCSTLDAIGIGLWAILALGLGISLVISLVGVLTVKATGKLSKVLHRITAFGNRTEDFIHYCGNVLLVLFATFFLYIYW